jgi:hypothetical protein
MPLVVRLQALGRPVRALGLAKKIPISPANTGGGKINAFFHAIDGFLNVF